MFSTLKSSLQKLFILTGLALISTLLVGTGLAAQTTYPDDVHLVKNGASPAKGLEVVQLEEMWRAGGEDSEVIFGHIFRAEADDEGNAYLLDTQLRRFRSSRPPGNTCAP